MLSKITIRNFCVCTQKTSTSLLRICVYAQKIQQMIIIQSSNNPRVDVLRPAQKLHVWNTYIPELCNILNILVYIVAVVVTCCYLNALRERERERERERDHSQRSKQYKFFIVIIILQQNNKVFKSDTQ